LALPRAYLSLARTELAFGNPLGASDAARLALMHNIPAGRGGSEAAQIASDAQSVLSEARGR
jgi:hypothetical protein